jgi:hypothetical protein
MHFHQTATESSNVLKDVLGKRKSMMPSVPKGRFVNHSASSVVLNEMMADPSAVKRVAFNRITADAPVRFRGRP